jgi:hypothetical protein
MITRIERDIFFAAGVHFDDAYYINTYDFLLSMLVETDIPKEHTIAMDRFDLFIKDAATNAVFINEDKHEEIEKYKEAGLKIITLPGEPFDQIVAMVLLLKLNAIMENRIKITDITISSLLGEGIRYPIVTETAENADMMLGDKWWHNSDMETTNQTVFKFEPENNIVKLFDDSIWVQYDLSWKDKPKNLLT